MYCADHSRWQPGRRADDISRSAAAFFARCVYGYPASQVDEVLGYASSSSVSEATRRIESHLELAERKFNKSGDCSLMTIEALTPLFSGP